MTLQHAIENHISRALYVMLDEDDTPSTYLIRGIDDGKLFSDLKYENGITEDVDLIIRTHEGMHLFFNANDNQKIDYDSYDFQLHDINGEKYYVSMLDMKPI
jgi:hypothetical protein